MSTECNKALRETEQQRDYYKEMYEMRTNAYMRLAKQVDTLNWQVMQVIADNRSLQRMMGQR